MKVSNNNALKNNHVCIKSCGNASSSCWDTSVWDKATDISIPWAILLAWLKIQQSHSQPCLLRNSLIQYIQYPNKRIPLNQIRSRYYIPRANLEQYDDLCNLADLLIKNDSLIMLKKKGNLGNILLYFLFQISFIWTYCTFKEIGLDWEIIKCRGGRDTNFFSGNSLSRPWCNVQCGQRTSCVRVGAWLVFSW